MIDIRVWGEYACFTRPEFKAERVSYPVITPSAARGVLEAIYWKPQIRYRIRQIGVLRLGSQMALMRNEISSRQSDGDGICVEDMRQQRTSLILRDVAYRIQAWIELTGTGDANIGKHLDTFKRRLERGGCHQRPCLGCREFAAHFAEACDPADAPDASLRIPVGRMLFDTAYVVDAQAYATRKDDRLEFWRHDAGGVRRKALGYAERVFFDASVDKGWMRVPESKYAEIRRLEGSNGVS